MEKQFVVGEDVLSQPVDNELVILDLKTQKYYGLDSIGARIWALLAEHGSAEAVTDRLCNEYEADRAEVLRDVQTMIQDFKASGLVMERTN